MIRILVIFILSFSIQVSAQVTSRNAVFAELGGNGYYYSLNYERTFSKNLLIRAGIGAASKNLIVPVLAGKCIGKGNHFLELSAGVTFATGKADSPGFEESSYTTQQLFAVAFIGYRFQKPEKKFLFRVGYTPFYKSIIVILNIIILSIFNGVESVLDTDFNLIT